MEIVGWGQTTGTRHTWADVAKRRAEYSVLAVAVRTQAARTVPSVGAVLYGPEGKPPRNREDRADSPAADRYG